MSARRLKILLINVAHLWTLILFHMALMLDVLLDSCNPQCRWISIIHNAYFGSGLQAINNTTTHNYLIRVIIRIFREV